MASTAGTAPGVVKAVKLYPAGATTNSHGGVRDFGKVMAVLKGKYTGQMDFGAAGPRIKAMLS